MDTNDLSVSAILEVYLPNIANEHRDAVVGSLMKAKLIQDAFNDPRGKQILEAAVNMITQKIQSILACCKTDAVANDLTQIKRLATEINTIEQYLYQWAAIYSPLPQAKEEITGKKRRTK